MLGEVVVRLVQDERNYDPDNISRIYSMMGEKLTSAKKILLRSYLFVLINRLKWATNFHLLGDASLGDPGLTFRNFDSEYHFNDETFYFDLTKDSPPIEELDRRIKQNVTDGEKWIRRLGTEQPLCHQKYLRYQDIRISSIGCGKWRGALPPSALSKERLLGLIDAFDTALKAWCDGHTMKDNPIHDLITTRLGEATSAKKELIRHFLLQPLGSTTHYYWLEDVDRRNLQQGRGY